MLLAIPPTAALLHRAFVLTPDAAAVARSLAGRVVEIGALAASPEIGAWMGTATPRTLDRPTPLDPRVAAILEALRARPMPSSEMEASRDAAIAAWSSTPRDVWRSAEEHVVHRVIRALKLLDLDAPAIILDREYEGLATAIAALDGPAPIIHVAPSVDPGAYVELAHAMQRHARADLSLGASTAVLEGLGAAEIDGLSSGEPLASAAAMRAREAVADEEERFVLQGLRAWMLGDPAALAAAAKRLATTIAAASSSARTALCAALDRSAPELLRGGDYVASTLTRLAEIADDAAHASERGLLLVSELAPDPGV